MALGYTTNSACYGTQLWYIVKLMIDLTLL